MKLSIFMKDGGRCLQGRDTVWAGGKLPAFRKALQLFSTLKMATVSSEMFVPVCQIEGLHLPKYCTLRVYRSEKPKSHTLELIRLFCHF
jgi:hypothetical protein